MAEIVGQIKQVDGGRLAAGCFDGTVALIRCDGDEDDDEDESVFQAKEHQLPVFAITWNRWNRNLLASRSRDDVLDDKIFC